MRCGMVTVKVVPTPFWLSTSMVPCIISTSLFTMGIPSPVPSILLSVVLFSLENSSKMWGRKSSDMPMPLSRTVAR